MKRFISLVFSLICIASCQKAPELSLSSPATFELSADENSGTITFTANRDWTASCSDSWIHVSPSFGTAADGQITVSVLCDANTSYDDRSGTVTIKAEDLTQTITLKQAQKDALIVKGSSYNMPYGGGELEVKVETNVSFDVTPDVDWIHFVQTKALNSLTVCLTIDENKSYGQRVGTVKIAQKNGTLAHFITIGQTGCSTLDGIWKLEKKSYATQDGVTEVDYSNVNFFLALGDFPFPHAIAKKGGFSVLDLKDVDIDTCRYTYNADEKKISFSKLVWLTEGIAPIYSMSLLGTFDVLELTGTTFVIQQKEVQGTTTYNFIKYQ